MTDAELQRRYTKSTTDTMVAKCLQCESVLEIDSRFSDGQVCKRCGGQLITIGYLKPPTPRKRPTQHEGNQQQLLFNWAAYARGRFPELNLLYHIPNGGSRNKQEAANLKRQGVKSGVPDLCLPVPRRGYHGMYIEMKYGKNKPTSNQNEWINSLRGMGYAVAVCYGWEDASKLITKYLERDKGHEN